jgi:heterodisulfide reductase subunit B
MSDGDQHPSDGSGIAGHGAFFQPTNLPPEQAARATEWVKKHIDRRALDLGERMEDVRSHMWQLEKEGEIIVHRVGDSHQPVNVQTLFGWNKKIPTIQL